MTNLVHKTHILTHADLVASGEGINVTQVQRGVIPNGTVTVSLTNEAGSPISADIDIWANSSSVEGLLNIAFGGSLTAGVSARVMADSFIVRPTAIRAWRITFLDYAGVRPLLRVNATGLRGSAQVFVDRVTSGTVQPKGYWTVEMGGRSTEALALNESESGVEQALKDAFPEAENVDVIAVPDASGMMSPARVYPWHWVLRFSRPGIAGSGPQRCIDPRYIDWDPEACPSTAPDLFLSFYPYYWPVMLEQPADAASPDRQKHLLAKCAIEAQELLIQPATCHALVPLETLPVCGVGSGTTPPCWAERFSRATVLLRDGSPATFARDDSRTPSDRQKGYRFWKQEGIAELQRLQALRVNFTRTDGTNTSVVSVQDSGMDVRLAVSRGSQVTKCSIKPSSSDTQLEIVLPSVKDQSRSFAHVISEDVLYIPLATWRLGRYTSLPDMAPVSVTRVAGALASDDDGAAGFSSASFMSLPYSYARNPSGHLTVELWARLAQAPADGNFMPLVRSIGNDAASGYALIVAGTGHWQFILGVGMQSQGTVSRDAYAGMLVLEASAFSACTSSSAAVPGEWTHVAATYDGTEQRIYVNGNLSGSVALESGSYRANIDGGVIFGGGCDTVPTSSCADPQNVCAASSACTLRCTSDCIQSGQEGFLFGTAFVGALDEVMLYDRALSPNAVKGHASAGSDTVHATVSVVMGNAQSTCSADGACNVVFSSAITPLISSIQPSFGWTGSTVTVVGAGFSEGMAIAVGGRECNMTGPPTDTQAVCAVQDGSPAMDKATVSLFVPARGFSANKVTFTLTAHVLSVAPALGSLVGGTTVTILGTYIRMHACIHAYNFLLVARCCFVTCTMLFCYHAQCCFVTMHNAVLLLVDFLHRSVCMHDTSFTCV